MTVVFDPTASLVSNRFVNESHVVTEPYCTPTNNPFYLKDLEIKATPTGGGADVVLDLVTDFSFSPPYVSMQIETGLPVHSYIILNDYEQWSHIKFTYRAVGQDTVHFKDTALLNEIAQRGDFDRLNLSIWRSFTGELTQVPFEGFTYNLQNSQILQMFMLRMSAIAIALQEPSRLIEYVQTTFATIQSNVTTLLTRTNSWKTAFDDANFFDNPLLTPLSLDSLLREKSITRLTGDLNLYVNPDLTTGTEDGLSPANAFTKIQDAFDYVSYLVGTEYDVFINLADGIYNTASSPTINKVNNINLTILGNNTNPENVVLKRSLVVKNSSFSFGGLKFSTNGSGFNSPQACLFITDDSKVIQLDNVIYGDCPTVGTIATSHIFITGNSVFTQVGLNNYKIEGTFLHHIVISHKSEWGANDVDLTLVGTPSFTGSFIFGNSYSSGGFVNGYRVVGSATGKKYTLDTYASITGTGSNGGSINGTLVDNTTKYDIFPGDVAGTVNTANFAMYS